MPTARFARLGAERRQRLLQSAAQEFAARGYDGASLKAVLERAELSKGQLYYYFEDKADLFAAVLDWVWRGLWPEGLAVDALEAANFWPTLERLTESSRAQLKERPWLVGFSRLFYAPPPDPAIRALVDEKFEVARHFQRLLIRRGREVRCIRDDVPEDLLDSLLFAADAAFDRWYLDNFDRLGADEREAIGRTMFAMIRQLLEPPFRSGG